VPNVQPFPPLGNSIVPPTGSGYYTLLERLRGDECDAPPKYPYPPFGIIPFSFYNADWRYLDNAGPNDHDPFDFLKRIRFLGDFMFTTSSSMRVKPRRRTRPQDERRCMAGSSPKTDEGR
jgi:hypothetical protein